MISKKEVEHIAKLARLGLKDSEIQKLQKELSLILEYIDQLKKVDVAGIVPTSHSISIENVKREDKVKERNPETRKKILEEVPEKKEEYIKVRPIL
ncbi:Asp-tRNA(Asn)/Glu-tRNA(Gln) amidotransferase subunit GatC [Patescibacteria group bacterium]